MLNESVLVMPKISNITFEHNFSYYPILLKSHSEMLKVKNILFRNNIGARRYFYPSLNTLPFLPPSIAKSCEVSESISSRVICLPLYFNMKEEDIITISKLINRIIK